MATSYTTAQGDMWDLIAKRKLGSESYMVALMEANPAYMETVIFPAGVTLTIPDIDTTSSTSSLPPWKVST